MADLEVNTWCRHAYSSMCATRTQCIFSRSLECKTSYHWSTAAWWW